MLKRILDIFIAIFGLLISAPLVLPFILIIWLTDFKNPFYMSNRVGKNGKLFKLIKLRTMKVNADKKGIDSTSLNDPRITKIGHFIRKTKMDELPQLINVLTGSMSLVGPRPNVKTETDIYTDVEKELLTVKPGITDISSTVFSDLAEILKNSKNPNLDYNQLVRPWKSRLGIIYVKKMGIFLDFKIIGITIVNGISRKLSLKLITKLLIQINAPEEVIEISKRKSKLQPHPPPGANKIVLSR
ncbi:MAG: sugar transferase [Spirochaetia bacterium]|nr:sugar transferase [Spirochaetia bacterium]